MTIKRKQDGARGRGPAKKRQSNAPLEEETSLNPTAQDGPEGSPEKVDDCGSFQPRINMTRGLRQVPSDLEDTARSSRVYGSGACTAYASVCSENEALKRLIRFLVEHICAYTHIGQEWNNEGADASEVSHHHLNTTDGHIQEPSDLENADDFSSACASEAGSTQKTSSDKGNESATGRQDETIENFVGNNFENVQSYVNSEDGDEVDLDEIEHCRGDQLLQDADSTLRNAVDRLEVYANGTTSWSSTKPPVMGYGVYFADNSPHNCVGRVEGPVSSQRVDTKATLEALKIIAKKNLIASGGIIQLCINSRYVKSALDSWLRKWKSEGWKNANKGLIKNGDLWKQVDTILTHLQKRKVHVSVVQEPNCVGSFSAGRMAVSALKAD